MKVHIVQPYYRIADFDEIFNILQEKKYEEGITVFPELFLTGYPLQDLCLQKSFINRYQNLLKRINEWSESQPEDKDTLILLGGLEYEFDDSGNPIEIQNVVFALEKGKKLRSIYSKALLANYDIYNERKYFTPGTKKGVLHWKDKVIGLFICQDMWKVLSPHREIDPVEKLKQENINFDLLINFSASCFYIEKNKRRLKRISEVSKLLNTPLVYVNKVGCEDEIIFDGGSCVVDGDDLILQMKFFEKDQRTIEIGKSKAIKKIEHWENLYFDGTSIEKRV